VAGFHRFFTGTNTTAADALITSLREPVLGFIKTAETFTGGADGRYDPFVTEYGCSPAAPGRIAHEMETFLGRLLHIAEYAPGAGASAASPAARYLRGLAARMKEHPPVIAIALGYGALALLRPIIGEGAPGAEAARLGFDHWRLDRKLGELYRSLGVTADETRRITDLMKAVLSRTVPEDLKPSAAGTPLTPGLLGAAFIERHYQDEDFRRILGINLFEDVTWFNKEGFEAALFYGSLFFTLENDAAFEECAGKKKAAPTKGKKAKAVPAAGGDSAPAIPGKAAPLSWPERTGIIAELSEALARAEEASGYRLDGLLDSLAGTGGEPGGKAPLQTPHGKKK
jgi:hypothetical protein